MGAQLSNYVFRPEEQASYDESSLPGVQWTEDVLQDGKKIPVVFYEVNVLCFDYTGYGIHRHAKPSEKECYEDITAAYHFLTQQKCIPSDRIILMGKNLGTAPTIHLAASLYSQVAAKSKSSFSKSIGKMLGKRVTTSNSFKGIAGVILQTPFTSVVDLVPEASSVQQALISSAEMFENIKKIPKVKCPIFIFHGQNDEVIPVKHAQKLAKHIMENLLWNLYEVEEGTYHNLETEHSDDILEEMLKFVEFISPQELLHEKKKKEGVIPARFTSSPIQLVTSWLKTINLEKHAENLVSGGFYDPSSLSCITEDDLIMCGILETEDQKQILEASKNIDSSHFGSSGNLSGMMTPTSQPPSNSASPQSESGTPVRSRNRSNINELFVTGKLPKPEDEEVQMRPRVQDRTSSGVLGKYKQEIQSIKESMNKGHSAEEIPARKDVEIVLLRDDFNSLLKRVESLEATVKKQQQLITSLESALKSSQDTIVLQSQRIRELEGTGSENSLEKRRRSDAFLLQPIGETEARHPDKVAASPEELEKTFAMLESQLQVLSTISKVKK